MQRHPFDPISFIFGAALLGVGALILAGEVSRLVSAWLPPAIIIGVGLALLVAGWQTSRRGTSGLGEDALG